MSQNISIIKENLIKAAKKHKIKISEPFISYKVENKTTAIELDKILNENSKKLDLVLFVIS